MHRLMSKCDKFHCLGTRDFRSDYRFPGDVFEDTTSAKYANYFRARLSLKY